MRQWSFGTKAMVLGFIASLLVGNPAQAVPEGWHTSGSRVLAPAGAEFVIGGINWYGFETRDKVAHGLWAKDFTYIVDQVRQYGYNTIRIPFSNEMWENSPIVGNSKVSASVPDRHIYHRSRGGNARRSDDRGDRADRRDRADLGSRQRRTHRS